MKRVIFLLTVILSINIYAQSNQPPCSTPEAAQFDFWAGEWNLEWVDQKGNIQSGSNSIKKILGGCVIEENFTGSGEPPFLGKSVSVYSTYTKKWHQTWVDNTGGYLDLIGDYKDGKMILGMEFMLNGKKTMQRMIFYDIQKDNFKWNWERSDDEGKTWNPLWKINYKRKV